MRRKFITFRRIIENGIINFMRNLGLSVAAMAVMVVTLTIVLFSIITNATFTHTIAQITDQIDVSVFLKDSNTEAQNKSLLVLIKKLPEVKKVDYLNKGQALQQYIEQNKANKLLATAVDYASNSIPATIHIYPYDLNQIPNIQKFLLTPKVAAQQSDASSYSGDREVAINNITHATNVLREIGAITIVVFTIICFLIIFNTIQMAIFNRRDEITNMRLLGASTSYIRGPFIVESAVLGFLSGFISIFIIYGAFQAASNALEASSLGLLDINYANTWFDSHFLLLLIGLLMLGILVGVASSYIATRRYLKFKTK
jgi:cell division transport system permease protein